MQQEKQLIHILICRIPRTYLLLDKNMPHDEKQRRIARYLDKNGKLKIDTVKNHFVYGIK